MNHVVSFQPLLHPLKLLFCLVLPPSPSCRFPFLNLLNDLLSLLLLEKSHKGAVFRGWLLSVGAWLGGGGSPLPLLRETVVTPLPPSQGSRFTPAPIPSTDVLPSLCSSDTCPYLSPICTEEHILSIFKGELSTLLLFNLLPNLLSFVSTVY